MKVRAVVFTWSCLKTSRQTQTTVKTWPLWRVLSVYVFHLIKFVSFCSYRIFLVNKDIRCRSHGENWTTKTENILIAGHEIQMDHQRSTILGYSEFQEKPGRTKTNLIGIPERRTQIWTHVERGRGSCLDNSDVGVWPNACTWTQAE